MSPTAAAWLGALLGMTTLGLLGCCVGWLIASDRLRDNPDAVPGGIVIVAGVLGALVGAFLGGAVALLRADDDDERPG